MKSKSGRKKIAIVGSGIVGQATGKGLVKFDYDVLFCDVNPNIIKSLNKSGYRAKLISELSAKEMGDIDFFMISVPTPTVDGRVDLRFIKSAIRYLGKLLREADNFPVFVVRSTVPPGTTENVVAPMLEKLSGKKINEGFGICMNPEFLREVSAEDDFVSPWMIVVGSDDRLSGGLLRKIYEPFNCPVVQMTLKEAEMMKYAHNLLNATKISFFNEMRIVGNEIGADPEVMFPAIIKSAEAMWNPEYGTRNFGPYGGVCLPKDTKAFFTWALETINFEMPVLKGTIETNEIMKKMRKEGAVESRMGVPYDIVPVLKRVPIESAASEAKEDDADEERENISIRGLPL